MTESTIIDELRGAFEPLAAGLAPDKNTIPTAIVTVQSGARLEVFRVESVEANTVAWRVRGFTEDGPAQLAAILGTQDGRAMVTSATTSNDASKVIGGLVKSVEASERALGDLSDAIAAAVREHMNPS